jgi:uncharacterized C2H2 Zn-finger protein
MTTGLSSDLTDLTEFKACYNCSGPKKFKCPRCGQIAKMLKVKHA